MKKAIITIILSFVLIIVHGQIKMHSNGQVSFQSTTTNGGVQILTNGISYFEPNITTSATALTQTKALAQLVRAWSVRYDEAPTNVKIRFYVTGIGDTYSNGYYTISPGGGHRKGGCLIENASALISNLNGYYYDNNDFEGFEPDFIDNPNVEPEAVEGLMKDLSIDKSIGLSTEDLETVLPEAIRHDPEGMVYINYSAIVPVLVEAFKEQQQTIELLQRELDELKANPKGTYSTEDTNLSKNVLYQNIPNPTNSSTTIDCYIDTYTSRASIVVYDLNGLQLMEYPVYNQGKNTVTIQANEFKPGIYIYSLLVDGKLIDTKRMVITSK